jgi:hypothetical protein
MEVDVLVLVHVPQVGAVSANPVDGMRIERVPATRNASGKRLARPLEELDRTREPQRESG